MSVVNEALQNLQARRAAAIASIKSSMDPQVVSLGHGPLPHSVVKNWVYQSSQDEKKNIIHIFVIGFILLSLFFFAIKSWYFFHDSGIKAVVIEPIKLSQKLALSDISSPVFVLAKPIIHEPELPEKLFHIKRLSVKPQRYRMPSLPIGHTMKMAAVNSSSVYLPPYQIGEDIEHAMDLYQSRGYDAAKLFLLELIHRYPKQVEYSESLVKLMMKNNHPDEAWIMLNQARKTFSTDSGLKIIEARFYIERKQWQKAHDLLNENPALDQVEYLSLLAMSKKEIQDMDGANAMYQKLNQLEPNNPAWSLGLAMTYESMGFLEQAKTAYLAAQNSTGLSLSSYSLIKQKLAHWGHEE